MTITEKYNMCVREAVERRRVVRRELAARSAEATAMGQRLKVVADRLIQQPACQVANEHKTVVFRTPTPPHLLLDKDEQGPTPVPHPSLGTLVDLFTQLTNLKAELAELDRLLE